MVGPEALQRLACISSPVPCPADPTTEANWETGCAAAPPTELRPRGDRRNPKQPTVLEAALGPALAHLNPADGRWSWRNSEERRAGPAPRETTLPLQARAGAASACAGRRRKRSPDPGAGCKDGRRRLRVRACARAPQPSTQVRSGRAPDRGRGFPQPGPREAPG